MIKEKIKTINRCDLVSLAGTALYALFGMANLLFYAVLQEPVPFITMCAVFIVGILISLFIYKNRLPMLWLFLGIGGFVAHFCSNMFGYVSNVVFLFQGLVSAVCFLLGVLLQFKKKWYPRRFAAVTFSVMLVSMALFGGFWGGNIVYARKKTGSAQNEVWAVPEKYDKAACPEQGRVEKITYDTKAYATDGRSVTKSAYVYLPYGYSERQEYNILYLMHGTGDREDYWLIKRAENKTMLDNMIYYKDIEPLIVVTPTWYTEEDCMENVDALTYSFKEELRNDLMPAIEGTYSTYAEAATPQGFTQSRDHRAFAGLSRGSATTFRAAFCTSLDYFSWFGAFSGCLTTEEEFAEMRTEENKEYSIHYLYNTSGSFDFLMREHVRCFRELLSSEERLVLNRNCSFDIFPMCYHSMDSWHLALYNGLQKFFS